MPAKSTSPKSKRPQPAQAGGCRRPSFCSPSGIEAAVCNDIAERQQKGIAKYGVTVAENPLELREWLQHAYEETLDKAIYLKRAIAEMENEKADLPRTGDVRQPEALPIERQRE